MAFLNDHEGFSALSVAIEIITARGATKASAKSTARLAEFIL
jgi:hypothetical protein